MLSIDDRVEKHRAKIETYSRYRDNAEDRGNANISKAKELGDMVPMGKPILVGHHSERGHRAHISRMDSNMRKGCEELSKAEYWRGKIEWHEAQIKRLRGLTLTAEQKRTKWEEAFRSKYKVGDTVKCWLRSHVNGGLCEIVKMNVKTARVRFADRVEWTQNLSLLKPKDD